MLHGIRTFQTISVKSWVKSIQQKCMLTVPRSVVIKENHDVMLHGFADASKVAVAAAVYIVSSDETGGTKENLLLAKSRLAPKALSVPTLEFVAAHTLSKLMADVKKARPDINITSMVRQHDDAHLVEQQRNVVKICEKQSQSNQ